jgi:MoaA/NifB/PqqE/SkfB family radical SAM enzyme
MGLSQSAATRFEICSSARWENFSLNAQERFERKLTLESFPPSVMLPTGQRCNLTCEMCIDRSDPEIFSDLSFEDFLKFTPALDFASSIAIYGWGEPFINPDYDKILDYIVT